MNWFDTSGLTNLAMSALKEAQKTIDKALDIQDESGEEQDEEKPAPDQKSPSTSKPKDSDFLASWGLTVSAESGTNEASERPVVTESPSSNTASVWGSLAGSFFENSDAIVRPPKAKSMNVISDSNYGSQEDLFSKSQLVMSDHYDVPAKELKIEERRSSSRGTALSLVSSRNSSDSVEVLSLSQKSTPDSEAVSVHSTSHSSTDKKLNSESVEVLPDSLVSPSSIELLGFDSNDSDKNSSPSLNLSPDDSDKKSTPIGDRTEKMGETADSVSLVADDDEDTISYNSISECTAPTVLDTDEKIISRGRSEPPRKLIERELTGLDSVPSFMHLSETSSTDGSWSDRTLNADNDSILDSTLEERKELPEEVEKLSDSSSFYNVQATMVSSSSSVFVSVEKQHCNPDSAESSQKESVKERISPISSDSKSDLVKIGSDRTSGHTSGDELETATSSDIEIIPSPNSDNHGYRSSPVRCTFKDKAQNSANLVDIVLGKNLASKVRGHNRELSETSILSNTSDESQGSENDRLMRRLCEMAEILEARENKLIEVCRSNAELKESNSDLKGQVENLMAKHESGDISSITEEYTQRMSALEKKFQQAIREKDQLRKQLETMKSDTSSRKTSSEIDSILREKDEMITQLQEEGEKLSRQQLQHSNIIKKLRLKEKDNEQVIKSLRDKVSELTAELDRLKRSMSAKEEVEVSQIEAVYRLTTANKKMEIELMETKSSLEDTVQRLESTRTSYEAARRELTEMSRTSSELQRRGEAATALQRERDDAVEECQRLRDQLQQLRTEMVQEERRWASREESLRLEVSQARAREDRPSEDRAGQGAAALLAQLANLQRSLLHKDTAVRDMQLQRAELETSLTKATERCRLAREECQSLQHELTLAQELLQHESSKLQEAVTREQDAVARLKVAEDELISKSRELEQVRENLSSEVSELKRRVSEYERTLAEEQAALDTEKKRNALLQEQLSTRGDVSPSPSLVSDTASLWNNDEPNPDLWGRGVSLAELERIRSLLQRREGELRSAAQQLQQAQRDRAALQQRVGQLTAALNDTQSLQEQYDALLQMYGEKEEQVSELKLDLHDVTQLYKAQLDELCALKKAQKDAA